MAQTAGIGREFIQLDTSQIEESNPLYRILENNNRALRQIWDRLDALEGRRGTVPLGADIDLNEHKVTNSADPSAAGDLVSKGFADSNYGARAVAAALQIAGSAPLNVSGLRGVLAQPQPASAPEGSTTLIGNELDGALFVEGGILYRVDRTTDPPVAVPISALGTIIQGLHATRLSSYDPADYPLGTVFEEIDRGVAYFVYDNSGTNVWAYFGGYMVDTLANRPADLGTYDERFPFLATDTVQCFRWHAATGWIEWYELTNAATATVTSLLSIIHHSSGAPAAGFGGGLSYYLDSSTNTSRLAAGTDGVWDVATNGSETASWAVKLRAAGVAAANYFRVLISGIRFNVGGFWGIIIHANSADRTYTLPDDTGTLDYSTTALTASNLLIGAGTSKVSPLGSLGSATTVLHGNASGAPTFAAISPSDVTGFTLFTHYADAGNVTTGETDLYPDTLGAGQFNANGASVYAFYGGLFVFSATATRQVRAYFGGSLIFDSGSLSITGTNAFWSVEITVIRESSSIVRCTTTMTTSSAALVAYTQYQRVTGLTLANTQVLKLTGQAGGIGAATDDIVAKQGFVGFSPAA